MAQHSNAHPAYRPDVDGLRAVAVLAVIGFHAMPSWAPGGFVGVDIFFFISGYLISSIILGGLAQRSFSFIDFYVRRIKRIFPALMLVLAAVTLFGWILFLPDEHRLLGKHITAGTGFLSNILLWTETDYFDVQSELKPLLHLWSLGIEEQFYILWPLFLYVSWQWRERINPLVMIVLFAGASFVLNVLRVEAHPEATFYLPPTRFWELLMGGALAYATLFHLSFMENLVSTPTRRNALATLGLALLVAAVFLLNRYIVFPGWWALLPTTGAVLLIAAGPDTWVARWVLGNRAMVAVGLISYPLYLWHWPLLSFLRIVESRTPSPLLIFGAVALAFVLATLTYKFVEKPIRTSRRKLGAAIPLSGVAIAFGIVGIVMFIGMMQPRSARFGVERFLKPATEKAYPGPNLQPLSTDAGELLSQGRSPRQVLFIGDSNIEMYYPRIDKLLTAEPHRTRTAVYATGGGCVPIPNVKEDHHPACMGLMPRAVAYAKNASVDSIVIGANWYGYFVDPSLRYAYYYEDSAVRGPLRLGSPAALAALDALEAMIREFVAQGKKVVLVLSIPVGNALDPRTMIKRSLSDLDFEKNVAPLERTRIEQALDPVTPRLRGIAERTGAILIDPMDFLCDKTQCHTVTTDGEPMYRDEDHLRPSYVRESVTYLDPLMLY